MKTTYDLSDVCRQAFVILTGAVRITYRDGSSWAADNDEQEHPILPPLRAACLSSLINYPPDAVAGGQGLGESVLADQLRQERLANDALRRFVFDLQSTCERAGAPSGSTAGDLLAWIENNCR